MFFRVFFFLALFMATNIHAQTTSAKKIPESQAKLIETLTKLWSKNDFNQARSIVNQQMSQGKISKEIGCYLLAEQAVQQKDFNEWKKNILEIKNSSLLNNVKIVSELLEQLPSDERLWLLSELKEQAIFKKPFESSCPFYELNQRSLRGKLLLSMLSTHIFDDAFYSTLFSELYLGIPEAVDVKNFEDERFARYKVTLSAEKFIKRMIDLMVFGKNTEARETYKAALKQLPNLSLAERCELDYQDAKVERKMRNYKEARQKFTILADTCPPDVRIKARYMALMLASMANDLTARPQFDQFVADYPTHGFSDDVLFWAAKIERAVGDYPAMFKTLDELITKFPTGDMVEQALFLTAFERAKMNQINEAIIVLRKLENKARPDSVYAHQANYWLARLKVSKDIKTLKSVDKKTLLEVKKQLSTLVYSKNPSAYSWLSWVLLGELKQKIAPPSYTSHKVEHLTVAHDHDLQLMEQLIRVGLDEEARAMLMEKPVPHDEKKLGLWAQLFVQMKRPEIGYQRLIQCSGQGAFLNAHYPGLYQAIAYPEPYNYEVLQATKAAKISPYLVYSIMRRESGFIPTARSWAQARGLMQLMKKTADEQAKKISIKLNNEDDLYDPSINLLLGSTLIKNNWDKFGNLAVALAAYNGGPGLTRTWLKKNEQAPIDAFLETISVEETYRYLIYVLGNHFSYSTKDKLASLPKLDFYLAKQ